MIDGAADMTNCILWGDSAPDGPELWVGGRSTGATHVSHCAVQGGEAAVYVSPGGHMGWEEGNIDGDPLFVSPMNPHLRPGSPCIDAGMDAGVHKDMDGQPRPWGAGFDMGADELSTEPCSILASSGRQFLLLYLVPALAVFFFSRRRQTL